MKLENILIDDQLLLKICDFGFADSLLKPVTTRKGTHGYRAPETYSNNCEGFDGEKADMFALGVILFILEFGIPPFTVATQEDSYYRMFYRGVNSFKYFFRLHPATKQQFNSMKIDMDLIDLLMALLDPSPQARPSSVREIKKHPYLQK